ncbi:hypothetical protein R3P38DRAFT_3193982 [Favolaschia claudopus]|uniref:Uncharacterized protein n=1 Tax=Favolaschia claudopus TaxID=2862362 RepID=A0AAW0BFV0_9AGAR
MAEETDILEVWDSAFSTVLNNTLQAHCQTLKVEGGMFMVHHSQLQRDAKPLIRELNGSSPAQSEPGSSLKAFNISSRLLLMHPSYQWTIAAVNNSPNLTSLSLFRTEIPEGSWDHILGSIHAASLESVIIDLRSKIKAPALDQFLLRHPRISRLSLGRDLVELTETDVASKGPFRNLAHLSAPPSYTRFLMAHGRALNVRHVRLLIKVSSHLVFSADSINIKLKACYTYLERVHLTLVVMIDYDTSHWSAFLPEPSTEPYKRDSLRHARALEILAPKPDDAFEEPILRWLAQFPVLESVSFLRCANQTLDELSFVERVREVCPKLEVVTLDSRTYDAVALRLIYDSQ